MDYNHLIEKVSEAIDSAGVAIIVIGAVIAAGAAGVRIAHHEAGVYLHFREQLGRTILLGLELLVAADIVRTVAAAPTLINAAVLAIIVLIRTFLSFSLGLELTGRWPWQGPEAGERLPQQLLPHTGRTAAVGIHLGTIWVCSPRDHLMHRGLG